MKTFITLTGLMIATLINFSGCGDKTQDGSTANQNRRQGRGNQGDDGGGFYVDATVPSGTSTGTTTYSASGFSIECSTASAAQNIMQLSLQTTKKSDGDNYNTMMYFDSACVNSAQITVSQMAAGDVATLTVTIKSLDGSEVLLSGTTAAYTQQAAPSPSPDSSSGGYGQYQRPEPTEVSITMTGSLGEKLVFTGSLYQSANSCGALVIESQDASGIAATPASEVTMNLSSSSSTGAFYSDNACTAEITSIVESTSVSSVTVYYKDSMIGSPTLNATDTAGASGLTEASETAQIENPTQLTFTSAALNQNPSVCGALVVETQDSSGNAVILGTALTVSLTVSGSSTGNFYSDSGCTKQISSGQIALNASDLTIYYMDTSAGTPTLTAASSGLTSATMSVTIQ